MDNTALLILIALAQYVWFAARVGSARGKCRIDAPKTVGDETFERLFRVQMNTLEQLIVYIPSLVIFTLYASARWAWIPGLLFILGRQVYAYEYVKDPASRAPGMGITLLANAVLLVGGLIGVVMAILN